MVYCGKPSGGCHACREKKTRCDQRLEGCTQCERAKRRCPGYRILGDVIFRNESDNVIRKIKAKEARTKQASAKTDVPIRLNVIPSEEEDAESAGSLEIVQRHESPVSSFDLTPAIEDRAAAYFISNFVVNVGGPTRGHLDYLTNSCGEDGADASLGSAIKAVGLASFAHASHAPSLYKNARYQYTKALQATNNALKSPVHVKKDSTLTAIMVLSIFETITGCNQRSLQAWAEHVNGAAALLKLRGRDQLNTPRGRRMFIQVASSLQICCIQRGLPLPSHIIEWTLEAKKQLEHPDPAFLVQESMMAFTNFRASVQSGSLSDPALIMEKALALDNIFQTIFTTNLPSDWEYETVYTDVDLDFVWNGRYHIYYDYWVSQIWNAMRTIRAMLNEMVRDALLKGFTSKPPLFTGPEHTAQFQKSTDLLFELQADILSTLPQHLGFVSSSHFPKANDPSMAVNLSELRFPWTDFRGGSSSGDGFPLVRMSGPYFLIWPLWFAGIIDIATEEVQDFVVKNLKRIGETMGIQQAVVLAKVIETKSWIAVW